MHCLLVMCCDCLRADVSTSAAVFVGLIGSMMGYPLLDPLAGLLVAGLIVRQVIIIDDVCVYVDTVQYKNLPSKPQQAMFFSGCETC